MLEIVFNHSAYVSMMIAQDYGKGPYQDHGGIPGMMFYGAIDTENPEKAFDETELAAIREEWKKEDRRKWEEAVPLGGKKSDVFGFELFLSMGKIADVDFEAERKAFMRTFADVELEWIGKENRLNKAKADLETVCQRIAEGQEARIWYGRIADDVCGMLWLCDQIHRRNLPCDRLYFIKLPDEKLGCGDVCAEEWHKYLSLQRPLTEELVKDFAQQWRSLQAEDAALRAVINGRALSVSEDFYDALIQHELDQADDKFSQSWLIGRILDKYPIGLGDTWIRKRLDKQIAEGKLEIVEMDPDCSWIRTLRKMK